MFAAMTQRELELATWWFPLCVALISTAVLGSLAEAGDVRDAARLAPLGLLALHVSAVRYRTGRAGPELLGASRPWLAVGCLMASLALLCVLVAQPASLFGGIAAAGVASVWLLLPAIGRRVLNWLVVALVAYTVLAIALAIDSGIAVLVVFYTVGGALPAAAGAAAYGCAALLDGSPGPGRGGEGQAARVDVAVQRSRWGFAAFVVIGTIVLQAALLYA